jgi:hypothetical protein
MAFSEVGFHASIDSKVRGFKLHHCPCLRAFRFFLAHRLRSLRLPRKFALPENDLASSSLVTVKSPEQ